MSNHKEIIAKLKIGGAKKLHILSDFDLTLTKPIVNGREVPSLISVLRDNGYLTKDYPKKAHKLFATYHPIEIDNEISIEIKRKKMEEWWRKHFALLIASGLTRQDIQHAMSSRNAELRKGAHEFFDLLEQNNIPLVIMSSSGLGIDSIEMFLEAEKEMRKNIFVISNQYVWNNEGRAVTVKEPIIHGMNKDETLIKQFPTIYKKISQRKNVVLLGDNKSDLGMVGGFDYDNLLTIGYTNSNFFDVQLDPSESLAYITKTIKHIL